MWTDRGWAAAVAAAAAAAGAAAAAVMTAPAQAPAPLTITDVSPADPRAGQPVQVTVAAPGREAVRVCLVPMAGAERCEMMEGDGRVTLAGPYPGRWTVTAEAAGEEVTRQTLVRPGSGRLVVLAAGDSLVRNLAAGIGGRFERRDDAILHMDLHNGSGLTSPCCIEWIQHARALADRLDPDVVVVFLGGNDGYPLDGVQCCGDSWIERYAARQRTFIETLAQGGRTRVYYATMPAPSQQARRVGWAALNRALGRATANDEARVFDLGALMTPDFRYRRAMSWRGRRVVVRESDGIHLNETGGRIAARALLRQLREDGVDVPAVGAGDGGRGDGDSDGDPPKITSAIRLTAARMVVELHNRDPRRTLHEFDVFQPSTVRLDPAGIPACPEADALELRCGTRTGASGRAVVTPAGDASRATRFSIALVRLDVREALGLLFHTPASDSVALTRARLRYVSGRQRLRFRLPPAVVGTYGAYTSLRFLRLRLGGEHGRHAFVSVRECRRRAHRFKTRFRFLENGLTPDARLDVQHAVPCR